MPQNATEREAASIRHLMKTLPIVTSPIRSILPRAPTAANDLISAGAPAAVWTDPLRSERVARILVVNNVVRRVGVV